MFVSTEYIKVFVVHLIAMVMTASARGRSTSSIAQNNDPFLVQILVRSTVRALDAFEKIE
jgi:hypothetical protein